MVNSWAIDLNYFLSLCPEKDLRRTKFNELLQSYYDDFMESVSILGVKLPKEYAFADFQDEMKKKSFHGFFAFLCCYPIMIFDASTLDATPEEVSFDHDTKKVLFRNPRFRELVNLFLPHFIEAGAL